MDQSLVHTFPWGNSYGPMVLKVLQKLTPTLALVHGWPFPAQAKPCICLSDTRHFRHFRRFRGSEERSSCIQWVVKTAPFSKLARFNKNTVCATPTKVRIAGISHPLMLKCTLIVHIAGQHRRIFAGAFVACVSCDFSEQARRFRIAGLAI